MLTIDDSNFRLKNKELILNIINDKKYIRINLLTYLGVFNDRMDDIKIDIKFKNNLRKLSDLQGDNRLEFTAYAPTWKDRGKGIMIVNSINANKLDVVINLTGEYDYHIKTTLEATWLSIDKDLPYEKLEKYIDLEEIENIPFINEHDNIKEIKYMFKKEKVTYEM